MSDNTKVLIAALEEARERASCARGELTTAAEAWGENEPLPERLLAARVDAERNEAAVSGLVSKAWGLREEVLRKIDRFDRIRGRNWPTRYAVVSVVERESLEALATSLRVVLFRRGAGT